jgi:signal transduction histidine kinase
MSVAAGSLVLAVTRFESFSVDPAVGVVGEQNIIEETNDLVVIVDERERVASANTNTLRTIGYQTVPPEATVSTLFNYSVAELRDATTVDLNTTKGSRQYDSQVATVTDSRGRNLGAIISLRDVTDREIRKERLSVLNRVLRHNLRNGLDVVRANAEYLDGDHAQNILTVTDRLAQKGNQARDIDRIISESEDWKTVDISEIVTDVANSYGLTVNGPETLTLRTKKAALWAAVESAVDNAVTHANNVSISIRRTEKGAKVQIADDGPGIPEDELKALDVGAESQLQHSTGLGLWKLSWAVRTLNGEVKFNTNSGTTVILSVPDTEHESTDSE